MSAATSWLGSVMGTLTNDTIGLITQPIANQEQVNMDQQLTNSQLNANEASSAYNYQQQYDLWQKTNYPAQVQQMQQAGLNPALMYSGRGAGGSTTGSPSGGMGIGPSAPNMMGGNPVNIASTQADIDLKKAQADNIRAQTPQEAGLMQAQIASITQGVQNQQAQQALTQAQTAVTQTQAKIQGATMDDAIAAIRATSSTAQQDLQQAVRNNYMDQNTMADKMATIHGIMVGTYANNLLTKAQTGLTSEQITKVTNDIAQGWKQIEINQQNRAINQMNANTNDENAQTRQRELELQKLINDMPVSTQKEMQLFMNAMPGIHLSTK